MKCVNRTLVFSLFVFSFTTMWIQLSIFLTKEAQTSKLKELPQVHNTSGQVNSFWLHYQELQHKLQGIKDNETLLKDLDRDNLLSLMTAGTGNDISDIDLPGTYVHLPHLRGHPEYTRPVFRLSRNRTGVVLVIGIPTIKRENTSYLDDTLTSLFTNLPPLDTARCLIIVFIAEPWELKYVKETALRLQLNFPNEISSGLLEVIAANPKFYPNLDALPLTLNDDKERVKWRSKQNLDYAFLMLHAHKRGQYYIQLEDDIITRPDFFTVIMDNVAKRSDWTLIRCSALGFIGKLLKTSDLPILIEFLFMFHGDKPGDWLLENLLTTKVCTNDMQPKECQKAVSKITIDVKPPIFQHIGLQSSLKGKIQTLKEQSFKEVKARKSNIIWLKKDPPKNHNPQAKSIVSSIEQFENYSLDSVYLGESFFWGYNPWYGDTIDINYEPPIKLLSFRIVTGSNDHPLDMFPRSTSVHVITDAPSTNQTDSTLLLGNFNTQGTAQGQITTNSSIKTFRIRVNENMKTWVFIKEIILRDPHNQGNSTV